MGRPTEKDWPKRPSNHQLQEAQKKTLTGSYSCSRGSPCPAHLVLRESPQAKQLCHFHAQLSRGQRWHRQKKSCIYAHRVALVVSNSLRPCRLWPSRLLCQGGGFSRQEYWSILANTGRHTLLECYTSCRPSRQPLEYLVLPEPLGPKQLQRLHTCPSLGQTQVLQGRLRSKPQWTTHM